MRELPEGWEWTISGDVCSSVRDGTHDTPKYLDNGIPLITSKNLKSGKIDFSTAKLISINDHQQISVRSGVDDGDILFAMIGTIGNPVIVNKEKPFSIKNVALFKKNPSIVESRYLRCWLSSYSLERILEEDKFIKGTTQKFIPLNNLRNLPIPLPPLNEQKRIADRLDQLLTRIDKTKAHLDRIPPLLKRFRQSVLAAATSGKLTADWREEKSEPDWLVANAEDVCEWITKGTTPSKDKMYELVGEIPYIKVYNLCFDGSLDFTINPTFIDRNTHEVVLKRSKIFPGDVLMNIVGPPLGKVSIVPSLYPEWNINQAIALFRVKNRIKNTFLAYVLMNEKMIAEIVMKSKATAGQFNVTLEICRAIEIPVPSLSEQQEIVRRVEALFAKADRIEAQYKNARQQVDRLTPALLAKAFRGELVPQDPKDEPASVLLERVKEARSIAQPAKAKRKAVK